MSFHVGQKVVCVDDALSHPAGTILWDHVDKCYVKSIGMLHGLKHGRIYTIRGFGTSWTDGGAAVFLTEIVRPEKVGKEIPFRVGRFRPLDERKTNISTFTAILKDTKISAPAE